MDQDDQHLQLLSIFHYVVGALMALFALFPLIHLAMGLGMVTGAFPAESADDAQALRAVGGVFACFAGALILTGLALAGCSIAAGAFLAQRTRYTFCLVVAAVECVFMPFGTVLGVFTLVVLLRDSVKREFGITVPPSAPPPAPVGTGL